jgi:hypothetical protein
MFVRSPIRSVSVVAATVLVAIVAMLGVSPTSAGAHVEDRATLDQRWYDHHANLDRFYADPAKAMRWINATANPQPQPAAQPRGSVDGSVWDRLAECESGGNWSINTGNPYSGGLQFLPSTWQAFGGNEFAPAAHQATRAQQIVVAERVLAGQGWGAWPACSAKLGLR